MESNPPTQDNTMTTDTPTLTIWNATTNKWEVYVSKKEQARRAAAKAESKNIWAMLTPMIEAGTLTD